MQIIDLKQSLILTRKHSNTNLKNKTRNFDEDDDSATDCYYCCRANKLSNKKCVE